jgi:acylphosphatase
VRRKAIFKGHVQGVGFRYTALMISKGYSVFGYVKNRPDGSVLVVAEGQKTEIDAFINEIKERKSMNIRSVNVVKEPETGEFLSFDIRH